MFYKQGYKRREAVVISVHVAWFSSAAKTYNAVMYVHGFIREERSGDDIRA